MSIFINLNPDISSEVKSVVRSSFPLAAGSVNMTNLLNTSGNMSGVNSPILKDASSDKEYFIWGGGGLWGGKRIVGP
jgi:hypothetical protein